MKQASIINSNARAVCQREGETLADCRVNGFFKAKGEVEFCESELQEIYSATLRKQVTAVLVTSLLLSLGFPDCKSRAKADTMTQSDLNLASRGNSQDDLMDLHSSPACTGFSTSQAITDCFKEITSGQIVIIITISLLLSNSLTIIACQQGLNTTSR